MVINIYVKNQHAKFHGNQMNSFENILVIVSTLSTVSKITVLRNRPQKVRISVMLVLSGLHMHTESTNCLLVVHTSSLPYFCYS